MFNWVDAIGELYHQNKLRVALWDKDQPLDAQSAAFNEQQPELIDDSKARGSRIFTEKVFQAVEYNVEWGLKNRDLSGVTAIGVDEISWRKGHPYIKVIKKYAAALRYVQAGKGATLIRIETSAGHGAGKPTDKIIEAAAGQWTFLVKKSGDAGPADTRY